MTVEWKPDLSFWSATKAEHACVGGFELVAFDIPAGNGFPAEIGFEVFGVPDFMTPFATRKAETLGDAKKAAEAGLTTTVGGRR